MFIQKGLTDSVAIFFRMSTEDEKAGRQRKQNSTYPSSIKRRILNEAQEKEQQNNTSNKIKSGPQNEKNIKESMVLQPQRYIR